MGFKCLTCCDLDFLAGGILCVALNLILRCKFSQNLPTNDSLQKDQVKLQVPENCILPGFFKILPPRRHSLGQRDLKGCGILSFSPSLYIYIYTHTSFKQNADMGLLPLCCHVVQCVSVCVFLQLAETRDHGPTHSCWQSIWHVLRKQVYASFLSGNFAFLPNK